MADRMKECKLRAPVEEWEAIKEAARKMHMSAANFLRLAAKEKIRRGK